MTLSLYDPGTTQKGCRPQPISEAALTFSGRTVKSHSSVRAANSKVSLRFHHDLRTHLPSLGPTVFISARALAVT